jgi:hypothetical protein
MAHATNEDDEGTDLKKARAANGARGSGASRTRVEPAVQAKRSAGNGAGPFRESDAPAAAPGPFRESERRWLYPRGTYAPGKWQAAQ